MANIIVLFEVKPTKAWMQRYLDLAASLKPLLAGFEGFIRAERFTSLNEEGKLLSMNVWTDEEAVSHWRNAMEHRMSQKEGREKRSRVTRLPSASPSASIATPTAARLPQTPTRQWASERWTVQRTTTRP